MGMAARRAKCEELMGMLYDWTVTRLGLDRLQSIWLVAMQRT